MGYFGQLALGASEVLSWPNIIYPIAGTLLAMVTSFLPGVGTATLAAFLLILTVNWEPLPVLLLFGALTGGATFMGSVTAILFNIPGSAPSAAALLDGYPLARKGFAKTALACAATASAFGSLVGVLALIAILPVVRGLLLEFGPLERLLLGVWGLTAIAGFPNVSKLKAAAATLLGFCVAMIGGDPVTGLPRWSFGSPELYQGVGTIALFIGVFTLAELLGHAHRRVDVDDADRTRLDPKDSVWNGIRSVFQHKKLLVRSSLIGTGVGIVPGVGGTVAGLVAYGQAAKGVRDNPETFGKGDIRGLIAPEAAVDAKDGGSLLPALAFGLPGSEAGVMLVAAMTIHGLVPGTPMLNDQLPLAFALIFALLFSNLLTSILGVAAAPYLARLSTFRIDRIALPAIIISLLALIQMKGQLWDVYVAIVFGLMGYVFNRYDWPRIPFVIAFVLGGFIQTNYEITTRLWDVGRLNPLDRPVAIFLALLLAFSLYRIVVQTWMSGKSKPFTSTDVVISGVISLTFAYFALASFVGGSAYSDFVRAIPVFGLVVSLAAFTLSVVQRRALGFVRSGPVSATSQLSARHWPLTLFAALPFAIHLIGLPIALGGFAGLWSGIVRKQSRTLALTMAAGVGGVIWYLTDQAMRLILPDPFLFTLFGF